MSLVVDSQKVAEILKYIKDKDTFVLELLASINQSVAEKNPQFIEYCLEEWEASAELNSIQGFAENVNRRFRLLVKAGLIDAE